jgi:DNA-directed RNA polymerase alpha subunit
MNKEIYIKQYQLARGTVTMPEKPMWVNMWDVCVTFNSLEEAMAFKNEIENPKPNISITMRNTKNIEHTGIEKLGLTIYTEHYLKRDDIISIEQLECCTEDRLRKTPNIGSKSIKEIKEQMAKFGYKLRDKNE